MTSRTSPIVIVLLTLAGATVVLAGVLTFDLLPSLTGSAPTASPTLQPTEQPTVPPTEQPSLSPTASPTPSPTAVPVSPSPEPAPTPGGTYVVQAGDTLEAIGLRFGVPWPLIAQANGIGDPYIIQIGQELVIPAPGESPTDGDVYIVQSGDTLMEIAYALDVSVALLAEVNGIEDWNTIYVGQELIIPGRQTAEPSPSPTGQP